MKKNQYWKRIRKFFMDLHLWMGLASGIIVVIICFSGTVYVYNTELTEMATPHLYTVQKQQTNRISPDEAVSIVQASAEGNVTTVQIPADLSRSYQINVKKEGDKSRGGTAYYINPYTGEILGNSLQKSGMQEFMSYMFSLHRWLLLDKIDTPILSSMSNLELGRKITGTATILFTLGCITGMVIWFPNRVKNWRQGLRIKVSGNWKRTNHDLHNTLAFYSIFFLLIMGLTGPQWSFEWYRTGLQKTLGTYKAPQNKEPKSADMLTEESFSNADRGTPASYSSLLTIADSELAYPGDYRISVPAKGEDQVTITKTKTGFFAPAAGDKVVIHAYDQSVSKKEIFSDKPFNERIAGSIKALHLGNVYGGFTKLLYFISCLIATSLPITGTLIWLNKKKKIRKKKTAPISVKRESVLVA